MRSLLSQHSEFITFAACVAVASGIHAFWLWNTKRTQVPWYVCILSVCVLTAAWFLSDKAGGREQTRIERMTGDFARLYGDEMEKRGHSRLANDAAADDPLYLDLIETEKHWLTLNRSVSDIYTLRKLPDGKNGFVVDSETDYDRDGKYEGERELRTGIGEFYEEEDAALERAFLGEATFAFEPITDRWGTWVSAFVPLRSPDGTVEGVLGVDFDAANFAHVIAAAKWRVLGLMALVQIVLLGSSIAISLLRAEVIVRHRAYTVLRESEERFSGAFEHAPIGVALVLTDGRWLKVNRALCDLLGYTEAELLTHNFQSVTHPDELEDCRAHVLQLIAGEIGHFLMEKRYVHNHGHAVTTLTSVSLVRDDDGQPRYLVAQIQDITERKRVEEDLRSKTALMEAQVNASLDGIIVVDQEGHNILQNQRVAELFKIPPHIAGKEDDGEQIRWVTEATKNPKAFLERVNHLYAHPDEIGRDEIELKDGTVMDRYSSPAIGKDGKHYGRVWSFRDITERKQAEAALAKLHSELVDASHRAGMAEVATGVLHNVGNVLNSVNVSASCVSDGVRHSKVTSLTRAAAMLREHEQDLPGFFSRDPRGAKLPEFLEQLALRLAGEQAFALTELGNLQKNIDHIKDIVAMQQSYGKVSGFSEKLDLAELINDTLRMSAESLKRHRVEVVREFEPMPRVTVDKHKVLQILINLVRNAKHACDASERPDRVLTVRLFNDNGSVKVSVTDNGVGIPPENLVRIFNHGFTTKPEGHGFGLNIGALAAQEMGGSLNVHSDGLGHGATFTLALPLKHS